MRITKRQLIRLIREAVASQETMQKAADAIKQKADEIDGDLSSDDAKQAALDAAGFEDMSDEEYEQVLNVAGFEQQEEPIVKPKGG